MQKKSVNHKNSSTKKKTVNKIKAIPNSNNTEKVLVENFVALQKVITHLAEKFDNLSTQISKLLDLFENSAKTMAKKKPEDNEEIIKKLDAIMDQNKTLARGLTLLHEPVKQPLPPPMPQPKPQPIMAMPPIKKVIPTQQPPKTPPVNIQGYQKSISENPQI